MRDWLAAPWPSPWSVSPGNGPAEPFDLKWLTTTRNASPPPAGANAWPSGSRALANGSSVAVSLPVLWSPSASDGADPLDGGGL